MTATSSSERMCGTGSTSAKLEAFLAQPRHPRRTEFARLVRGRVTGDRSWLAGLDADEEVRIHAASITAAVGVVNPQGAGLTSRHVVVGGREVLEIRVSGISGFEALVDLLPGGT